MTAPSPSVVPPQTPSLWDLAIQKGASDIHVVAGQVPWLRIDGQMIPVSVAPLSVADVQGILRSFLSKEQYALLEAHGDVDTSRQHSDGTRFRVNCHIVSGRPAFAARLVNRTIPSPEDLLLPPVVLDLCRGLDGLVLFTGPTGCGKSTSLASIIDRINAESAVNIITLEDPVEYIFEPKKSLISQRELGSDFPTFPEGLKHVLRQDPNIVMVGEMRDLESIALALTLAETGHLVLATLHTPNAMQSVDRVIDVFPSYQQMQVRYQLSLSLRAIVAQRLIPRKAGRIANREVLIKTPAVGNIIRENRLAEMESIMQTGSEQGMITFDQDLERLVREGLLDASALDRWAALR